MTLDSNPLIRATPEEPTISPDGEPRLRNSRFGERPLVTSAVTGSNGFLGSHLTERLLREGQNVVEVDRTPLPVYLAPPFSGGFERAATAFDFRQADLAVDDPLPLLQDVDTVFHLAGESGVRESWGDRYEAYVRANVLGTQRLLEACRAVGVRRVIIASSSSVYGPAPEGPSHTGDLPQPLSPYGVSKLAAERLALAYAGEADFDVCALRYFTVYGPRQRLTMLMSRILQAAHTGSPMTVFGDGAQRRHFTFVDDAVEATVLAGCRPWTGSHVVNVAGPSSSSVAEVLATAESVLNTPILVNREPNRAGDAVATEADLSPAADLFGYCPQIGLTEGITEHWRWYRSSVDDAAGPSARLSATGGAR